MRSQYKKWVVLVAILISLVIMGIPFIGDQSLYSINNNKTDNAVNKGNPVITANITTSATPATSANMEGKTSQNRNKTTNTDTNKNTNKNKNKKTKTNANSHRHRNKDGENPDSTELLVESARIQFTRIKIRFTQPVDPATITTDSLFLLGENNTKLARRVSLRAGNRMAVIRLENRINLLKPIVLVMTPQLSSAVGSPLEKGFIKGFNINITPPGGHKHHSRRTIVISEDPYIEISPGLFFLAPFKKGRFQGMGKPGKDEEAGWKQLQEQMKLLHRQKLSELEEKDKRRNNRHRKGDVHKHEKILDWYHRWCHAPELVITGITPDALVNHDVTCNIALTDPDNDQWFFTSVLDFTPYQNGAPISVEGRHWLLVIGVDRLYKGDVELIRFEIDKTPPEILSLTPSEDFSTRESQLTISGETRDASRVTINGVEVLLEDN